MTFHLHRWHFVEKIDARDDHPAIYKFVCDRRGCVKMKEGDLKYER